MAKQNQKHTFDFTGILNAEINQQDWKAKKKLLEEQFGKFKMALDTDLAEAEAQKILDMFNEKLNIQLNVEQVRKDAEAVKKIIETALASINNIDTSALRGIEDTLEGIAKTTKDIFDKMGSSAQKASKQTIASVAIIDKALEKLGGNFASVQEALDFEIKGSAEKQLEAVRKEQERLNEALKGDDWVKKHEALVRYTKAFEIYQDKVKNNEKKIPQDLSDLYHANVGKANDAKINLQHIVDRHDKKWSGETSGSGVVDTSKLATEKTLGDILNKLDKLKVSVSDDNQNVDNNKTQPSKINNKTVEPKNKQLLSLKVLQKEFEYADTHTTNALKNLINSIGELSQEGKDKLIEMTNSLRTGTEVKDIIKNIPLSLSEQDLSVVETYFQNQKTELVNRILSYKDAQDLKWKLSSKDEENAAKFGIGKNPREIKEFWQQNHDKPILPIQPTIEPKAVEQEIKESTGGKPIEVPVEPTVTTPNQQPVGATVNIDEATLGNAIANALKGVQLNANTQGEVKASIDATELKGVLHDGTAYDVKVVQDQQPATENGTKVAIDEAALESVLNRVFPKSDGSEPWAKDTTLTEVKSVLESIKTNTDKFVADNTDPRAETLKQEIQALKTKHPNDLFEAADNQKLITDKENELNNLGGKSINWVQISTALAQIAAVLTAKTIETAVGANTHAVEAFTQHLGGQTSYFENLQIILDGIADAFKQSNISTTIVTTSNVLEALNNTLNSISGLVVVPTDTDITPQQTSVNSVSFDEEANGLSKRKTLIGADGKPIKRADTTVEKTSNAVKTTTNLFDYDKNQAIPSGTLIVEKFIQEQKNDLKEVLTIYEEIGRNEAKIEGLQSEGEKDVYRQRNIELEKEAQELAKIYGLNVDLAAIEKARTDAKKSGMVRVDAAQERKDLNAQIKEARKQARINASNTSWNAGQRTLESLWKIDDDNIDLNKIPEIKLLQKELDKLSKTQKLVNEEIQKFGKSNHTEVLNRQTRDVAELTAEVKELVNNYERFSGSNATNLGGFTGGDWETQITTAIQAQYPGAKIKSINHDLQEVTYELKTGARAFTEYTAGVRKADNRIVALKGTTKKLPTFLEGVKKKLREISQYFSAMSMISRAMQELRKGIQYVREIDLALTELKKVTDETEATYDKFLDTASKTAGKIGSTIKNVVSSTADFARLGYSLKEAATFAESALILMNVSEFTDVSRATDTLISAVQAFGYTAETSLDVVDMLNMIGNNYAISTADLAQSLTKSSASLVAAGGNLAEAAALTATANKIIQDADSVGTALKTTSLRLRGTSVEVLEEEGLESDGAVTSKSKLQSKVKALSGVDILTATGEYKSTYEILSQIADVWGTINDMDQAALLELISGKRNSSVIAAILQNPKELKEAFEDANNAQGSALKENEKYMDSIQGKIDQLTNAVQTMWKNALDDDVVKFFVELLTTLVKILDTLGPIETLIAGIMTYITMKNGIDIFSLIPKNANNAKKKIAELKTEIAQLDGLESQKNLEKKDALTQQLRALEAQIAPSKELVAAQDRLVKAQNKLNAAKQKKGTDKALKPETVQRYEREVNKAKLEVDNLTVAQNKASKSGTAGFKKLGKSVGNFAKSVGKALAQMAIMYLVMQVVGWITEAIDSLANASQKAAEDFEELTNELKDTKSELEGINNELTTLDDKIAELTAKEKLSFTEQEELDRLKEERAELERELELKEALTKQKQEQVNSQTSDQVKYYKNKGTKTGKTASENVASGTATGVKVGAAVGVAGAAVGAKAGMLSGAWAGPLGMLIGALIGAAAGAAIGAAVGAGIAASEPTIGEEIDNMEANLAKKEEEVEKTREAYQKSGSDADKERYEKAQKALDDYRGEMSGYFTELGDYYDNVDLSEVEDPERYKELKKEMNDFYNERDKWLITNNSEGATSNAIERVFDKKENKKAKKDIEALMEQLKEDPGNTAIEQKIKNIINGSEALKADFEAIGIEIDDVANSFIQIAEDQLFHTLDGKVEELERARVALNSLLNGGKFNFEGKSIGITDIFTDEGKVVQTKLSEIFKNTSAETREAITGLLERSYDDIQNGTVKIETLLGEFASRGSEAIIKILEETSDTFEEISENMDKIQGSYSTLSNAVEQYNSAGFLTLDNLQSLLSLEPEYLALLQMENGQLSINQAGYEALIQTKLAEAKASVVQSAMTQLNALAAKKEEDAINDASTAAANSISNLGTYANALSDVTKNAIGAAGAVYAFNNAVAGAKANELVTQEEIDAIINSMDTQLQMIDSVGANLSTNFGSIMTGGEGGNPKDGGEDSDAFEDLLKKHQAELDAITHQKDLIQAEIDEAEAKGFIASEKYYKDLISLEEQEKQALISKQQALQDFYNAYSASMSTDEIDKWNAEMRETALAIKEADTNMIEFGNTIREIGEEYFGKISEDIDAINEEIEFMHGLLEDEPVADENGNWSNEALTRLGLYTQQMEKAAFETQRAKDELAELRANASEEDKNSDWYREKEEELTQVIYDNINAYNDYKDGIIELNEARVEAIKEGIEKEIEAYNDLLDVKREELDAERDLYDFKKNIEEQNKSIADTERKLAALSGSTAAEDIAERKRLEAELRKQQGDLDDTYYDHSMTAQQNALDEEGRYFEEAQNRRIESLEATLEKTEELIVNSMMDVMLNADTVHQTLNEQANTYGVVLSDELKQPWLDASAQAIKWRDELKKDMTEGEWAAMIGEGGAITAFSNGVATKLGGSWDTAKTKAKSYSDFLTGTELKNNLSGAITTFTTYLQKIVDKWNEIRNAAVAATSVTPTIPSGGNSGGSGENPTPSPSPTPAKTMNASGKNSSHIRVGKKTDALAKNKKTVGGVEYYLWSDDYYYPMSAFRVVTTDVDEKGKKTSVFGFPAGTTRYKYYAKGTVGTKHDGWAITDELGPELTMYAGKDGTLSFMRTGSTVIPAELTKELIDIGQVGIDGLMAPKFDSGINVINNAINKPEYNFNIEALVKADHIDQNSIKDVEKMVNKQFDEFTRKLNYSLKGVGGR